MLAVYPMGRRKGDRVANKAEFNFFFRVMINMFHNN